MFFFLRAPFRALLRGTKRPDREALGGGRPSAAPLRVMMSKKNGSLGTIHLK